MSRMILGGVFHRHQDLKMPVVHGGGYLTFYAARTDHVLLGTDSPYDMGLLDPLALIADARITDAERELIAGGNACRLLNIAR